jgi:hypothetical protein
MRAALDEVGGRDVERLGQGEQGGQGKGALAALDE